ncbi:hypothetical protein PINS_up001232 [Pythium insidiosum]|nr:hypothetical protein PINS_up001232 [Pythium insidiosum]
MSSLVMGSAMDDKTSMCLSPQDKLKSSAKVSLVHRKKAATTATHVALMPPHMLAMDVELADGPLDLQDMDLDLDLMGDDDDDTDMDAGWISDDNLRALEFDERLNQDIDWVEHEDVESSLKLEFVPDADNAQDFGFDPSSFLSPLRGGLTFEDSDVSSSFAESFSVDAPLATTQNAEKLLMSFDTMHFSIPSPTSSSTKGERAGLFAKKDGEAKSAFKSMPTLARPSLAMKGTMSPSLKQKAGQVAAMGVNADDARKDDARSALPKLSIPTAEPMLGVLNISTPTSGATVTQVSTVQKKIGSYSPNARRLRIQKFHEKRKNRTWKKSIKYDCRKKLADDRPRIKGRFVRVNDPPPAEVKEESTAPAAASTAGAAAESVVPASAPVIAGAPVNMTAPPAPVLPTPGVVTVSQAVSPALVSPCVSSPPVGVVVAPSDVVAKPPTAIQPPPVVMAVSAPPQTPAAPPSGVASVVAAISATS